MQKVTFLEFFLVGFYFIAIINFSGCTTVTTNANENDTGYSGDADSDSDTDVDTDGDGDTDIDIDTDTDTDSDTDSDGDSDVDTGTDYLDEDGDGWIEEFDCDETNSNVNPGVPENPSNNIDDDCDGLTDEEDDSGGSTDPDAWGCTVDALFIIDNSASMSGPQADLAAAFPGFVDAIWASLPPDTNIHVGITTSSFCDPSTQVGHSENNCEAAESNSVVDDNMIPPNEGTVGGNGWQGRLVEHGGHNYFEADTSDPSTMQPLKDWFSAAATGVGASGCNFEFNVAGAAYAFHPANDSTNAGFIRDDGSVLLIFIITNEADHSDEVDDQDAMIQMVLDAKVECGGAECIVAAGILPQHCVDMGLDNNYRFLSAFNDDPVWGDIGFMGGGCDYTEIVGDSLAEIIGITCEEVGDVT